MPLSRVERIAHRGASREKLENTLAAFRLALERGADAVELDVRVTLDGVPVVHHDADIGAVVIADSDWAAVSQAQLAAGELVPSLEDVLETVGDRATVYIELKGRNVEKGAVRVARAHGKRFAFHSFDHDAIERVARLAPDLARGALLDRGTKQATRRLREVHGRFAPRDIWPHFSLVDAEFADVARELGVRVIPWTVNETAEAHRLRQLGVAGICTDDVRLLANL